MIVSWSYKILKNLIRAYSLLETHFQSYAHVLDGSKFPILETVLARLQSSLKSVKLRNLSILKGFLFDSRFARIEIRQRNLNIYLDIRFVFEAVFRVKEQSCHFPILVGVKV